MESLQENKSCPKRSKFGFRRLLAIKKSIRDSFSNAFKSDKERTNKQCYTSPRVEPQRLEVLTEKRLPNFTSVMEFPIRSSDIDKTKSEAGWNLRHTSQLRTFKPETEATATCGNQCQYGAFRIQNISTVSDRVQCNESSGYKTIPERNPKLRNAVHERFSLAEPAVYTEPTKNSTRRQGLNSLSMPSTLRSRRNSPVYEPVAPAYPPKNYDQQKEHAEIVPHRMDIDRVQFENNRTFTHNTFERCSNTPKRVLAVLVPVDYTSETICNEWVVRDDKLKDNIELNQGISTGFACQRTQTSTATQITISMQDKSTQSDFELFKHKGNWFDMSENRHEIKLTVNPEMNTAREGKHASSHFLQPPLVEFEFSENNRSRVDVSETQTSMKGNQLDPPSYPNQGSMNNLVLGSDLISDRDMHKKPKHPRILGMTKFNTVPNFRYGTSSQFLSPPSADTALASADDSRSIFGSEGAESDFTFYPCASTSGTDVETSGVGNTPYTYQARSYSCVCGDPFSLSQGHDSSRSDFCGSSLDEVTRQFFLDDDVLSDDVFISETEQYSNPSWKYQNDASSRRLHSIEENCQNKRVKTTDCKQAMPFFGKNNICLGEWGNELWHAYLQKKNQLGRVPHKCNVEIYNSDCSIRSDETCAYKYDDIDEVLKNFRDLSESSFPSRSENDTEVTELSDSDVSTKDGTSNKGSQNLERVSKGCGKLDSPKSQHQDFTKLPRRPRSLRLSSSCCQEFDSDLADVFDSLRKNSLQFKSRQMWRQRRTNRKRDVLTPTQTRPIADGDASPIMNDVEKHSATKETSNAHYILNNRRENYTCSPKPLRGILKKAVLVQPISTAEKKLCGLDRESKTAQCKTHQQRRRAKSLGFEVYPLEKTEAVYGREILDIQYKVAKAHSPQSPVHAPFFNTIIDQAGNASLIRRSKSLPARSHRWFKNAPRYVARSKDSINLSKETSPKFWRLKAPTTEEYYRLPISTVIPEATSHLANSTEGSLMNCTYNMLKNNNVTERKDLKNNTQVVATHGQSRSCTQRYQTKNINLPPIIHRPGEKQQQFIEVRKDSLDLYKCNSCIHRRRKPHDKSRGPGRSNTVSLQRAISFCPSERSTATL